MYNYKDLEDSLKWREGGRERGKEGEREEQGGGKLKMYGGRERGRGEGGREEGEKEREREREGRREWGRGRLVWVSWHNKCGICVELVQSFIKKISYFICTLYSSDGGILLHPAIIQCSSQKYFTEAVWVYICVMFEICSTHHRVGRLYK